MQRKIDTIPYAIMQAATWSFYSIILGFSSNFLRELKFQDSEISVLLGITTMCACILQLVSAEIISRWNKISLYQVLIGMGISMTVSSLAMLYLKGDIVAVIGIAVACVVLQTLPAMVNSIAMSVIECGATTNYSIARGFGSLAYGVFAFMTGTFVSAHGIKAVPVLAIISSMFFIGSVVWYHHETKHIVITNGQNNEKDTKKSNFLKSNPYFVIFLVGSIFLFISHNLVCNFMMQIVVAKGGNASQQGLATTIAALTELPIMFGFPILLKMCKCEKWVKISSVFFVVKAIGLYVAMSMGGVYLAQLTQVGGFAIYSIASVHYAKIAVSAGESVRGQSYLAAMSTIGGLFASSTGGFMCQYLGVQQMILIAGLAAMVGAVVTVLAIQLQKKNSLVTNKKEVHF